MSAPTGDCVAVEGKQAYGHYRKVILTARQLQALNHLSPARAVRDTILLWAQILAAWIIVARWPTWFTVLPAVVVIGTRYYALYIVAHDGLHRRLFQSRRRNDLWNDLCILGAIGAITRLNRHNHMRHHATLALPDDPDIYKYGLTNKGDRIRFIASLTGFQQIGRALHNVFLVGGTADAPGDHYGLRDVAILAGWQVALIGGLTFCIGWWAYPLLWLLPVYVFTFAADAVRVMLEHAVENEAHPTVAERLITYSSSRLERTFFAPMNMNFHAAHHLWPSVPYYNLPTADAIMRSSPENKGLVWRRSYSVRLVTMITTRPWLGRGQARP